MNTLTPEELEHYDRHLVLKGFGSEGQLKLKNASVLVVGAGGLGCPALLYLAAAGVGKIGVVDFDSVQKSNLQRQVLFTIHDVGKNKAEAARKRLVDLNPLISISAYPFSVTSENILYIMQAYNLVIDCSDNFQTRYLINDACVLQDKPLVYGSVLAYEGHISVFKLFRGNQHSQNSFV